MAANWKKVSQLPDAESHFIELPYSVKGMDMSFSGIAISAIRKYQQNPTCEIFENLCYSFQETAFAMLTEVTERAMAHTGKNECLITGGVAASERLCEMLEIMCRERGARFFACPAEYAGDNGVNIAYTGLLFHLRRTISGFRYIVPASAHEQREDCQSDDYRCFHSPVSFAFNTAGQMTASSSRAIR